MTPLLTRALSVKNSNPCPYSLRGLEGSYSMSPWIEPGLKEIIRARSRDYEDTQFLMLLQSHKPDFLLNMYDAGAAAGAAAPRLRSINLSTASARSRIRALTLPSSVDASALCTAYTLRMFLLIVYSQVLLIQCHPGIFSCKIFSLSGF